MKTDKYNINLLIMFMGAGFLLLVILLSALFSDQLSRESVAAEIGIVQVVSALGYLVCVIFAACKGGLAYLKRYHYIIVLLVFFMLREFDFHSKFTTMGIFKTRFYISDSVPIFEKLIGALIIGLLLYATVMMLYRHSKQFLLGLKNWSATSLGALTAIILILLSKSIDGIQRKLNSLGIDISNASISDTERIEEIVELAIPIVIFMTFYVYFRQIETSQKRRASKAT